MDRRHGDKVRCKVCYKGGIVGEGGIKPVGWWWWRANLLGGEPLESELFCCVACKRAHEQRLASKAA